MVSARSLLDAGGINKFQRSTLSKKTKAEGGVRTERGPRAIVWRVKPDNLII